MEDLWSTVVEGNHPKIRRNTVHGFETALRATYAGFITTAHHQARLPLKESEQLITSYHAKIHAIIDRVDNHIMRRLENHENEIFSLVKTEIEDMKKETQEVIDKLNKAIALKDGNDQIWILNNELDYFKSQTFKLFQDNKRLNQQTKQLQSQISDFKNELENNDKLMQKMKRSLMRERMQKEELIRSFKNKMQKLQGSKEHFNEKDFEAILSKFIQKKRAPSVLFESAEIPVELTLKSKKQSAVIITLLEQDNYSRHIQIQTEKKKQIINPESSHFQSLDFSGRISLKKQMDRAIQTQLPKSQEHGIDFVKNGFVVNSITSLNAKNRRLKTQQTKTPEKVKEDRGSTRMLNSFNRSKLKYNTKVRVAMNRTSTD